MVGWGNKKRDRSMSEGSYTDGVKDWIMPVVAMVGGFFVLLVVINGAINYWPLKEGSAAWPSETAAGE